MPKWPLVLTLPSDRQCLVVSFWQIYLRLMALRAAAKRLTSSIVSRHGATGEGIIISCNVLVCFYGKQRSTLGSI